MLNYTKINHPYPEAQGWLGLKKDCTLDKTSIMCHLILVFVAYTFILMGGFRKNYFHSVLTNFTKK